MVKKVKSKIQLVKNIGIDRDKNPVRVEIKTADKVIVYKNFPNAWGAMSWATAYQKQFNNKGGKWKSGKWNWN